MDNQEPDWALAIGGILLIAGYLASQQAPGSSVPNSTTPTGTVSADPGWSEASVFGPTGDATDTISWFAGQVAARYPGHQVVIW